jgi:hypothetical protein
MNNVIEPDFLPHETNAGCSWPSSIGSSGRKERRRVLIVVSISKGGIHFLRNLSAFLS